MSRQPVLGVCISVIGLLLFLCSYSGLIKTNYRQEYYGIFDTKTKEGWGYTYQGIQYVCVGYITFEAQTGDWITVKSTPIESGAEYAQPLVFIKADGCYLYTQPLEHITSLVVGTTMLPVADTPYTLWLGVPLGTTDAGSYEITVTVSGERANPTITYTSIILAIIGLIITTSTIKKKGAKT
ncbi:MAG: hypothetical protein QXR17_07815 [Candidatus Bathyarchaeia archaeon]